MPHSFVTDVWAKVGQPGIGSGRSLCFGAKRCASLVAPSVSLQIYKTFSSVLKREQKQAGLIFLVAV